VSILLCTATQPGLDRLDPDYALPLSVDNEIIPDVAVHLEDLQRVELIDNTKTKGWTLDEVAAFIENSDERSILTVVNTKSQAKKLYTILSKQYPDWLIVHLSANMCPEHRRRDISRLKEHLQNKTQKCVCISTRLIEAGVDIDFDEAIRFLAGFDSIVQTAGRCNRNGNLKDSFGNPIKGKTWIINIVKDEERIGSLPELILGQEIMKRILSEFHDEKEKFNHNLLHHKLIARYFLYYYKQIPESLLKYKVSKRDETILDLLSDNAQSMSEYEHTTVNKHGDKVKPPVQQFRQSFETAWKNFEVIAQDTVGVIVPFGRGKEIIRGFFALPDIHRCVELLQEAQQYSVNIYFNELGRMINEQIIKKVPLKNDMEIYTVDEKHYDQNIGLTYEEGKMLPYMA
jgi:CRISPR-associated endonuclease/helicase Cas3